MEEKGNQEAEKRKREDQDAEKKRLAQIDLEEDMKRDNGLLSYDPRALWAELEAEEDAFFAKMLDQQRPIEDNVVSRVFLKRDPKAKAEKQEKQN